MNRKVMTGLIVGASMFAPVGSMALSAARHLKVPFVFQDDTFTLGEGRFEFSGRKPTGFRDFKYLYLQGAKLKASPGRRLLPQPPGTVRGELQGAQKYRLRNARFEGEHFSFETAAVRGVSYKFDGKVSNYSDDDTGVIQPQFKGTFTKLTNGKKTAESKVTLVWIEPEF